MALAAATGLLMAAMPAVAQVQKFPPRPIKLIVPVPPGSGVDLISRTLGQKMSEQMGVPVIVETDRKVYPRLTTRHRTICPFSRSSVPV